ncbi:peptidoglycan-binding protein [Streptomyces sp. NPDC019937]|uniref:peptidoglycan-binding protein n=1 Tax=Streptomyces sp. NPDC019937 TaxID=3154787 RepID=UPI0033C01E69
MARMPGATWRPVPNCTRGGQESVRGVVLHIMQGTLDGSDSWFRNSKSQASAHFGVGKDGRIFQWVDTADRAWAQAAGNRAWLSIEHEGEAGDALTEKQLAATARIVAWAHAEHGVPLQLADSPEGRGIGWHGMGGSAWGGHTGCPGNPIKAQRVAIIKAAGGTAGRPAYEPFPGASFFKPGRRSPIIAAMHKRLVAEGCNKYQSSANADTWGSGDERSYAAWQRKCGYAGAGADGIPGAASWVKLRVPNV